MTDAAGGGALALRRIVLLDSGPLGLVTNPKLSPDADACRAWLARMLAAGHRVLVPAIADYEVRRELRRAGKTKGLQALDALKTRIGFLPLTNEALLQAADFWATARQLALPTADRLALDGDAILAAQAATLDVGAWDLPSASVIVATTNIGHLSRFVDAEAWQDIKP